MNTADIAKALAGHPTGITATEFGAQHAPDTIKDKRNWARRALLSLGFEAEQRDGGAWFYTGTLEPEAKVSRQVRRAMERRAAKPAPGTVERKSIRYIGKRTKGLPFSRMILDDVIPSDLGTGSPATFVLRHPTKNRGQRRKATPQLVDLFFPSIPAHLAANLLGQSVPAQA